MDTVTLLQTLNRLRDTFLNAVEGLERSTSFAALQSNTPRLQGLWKKVRDDVPGRLQAPFTGEFVCAIVGGSGHGKTTIIDEMFPSLAQKGWLVTGVTDTTSQALRISYAPEDSAESNAVVVHSWDIKEIKALFADEQVARENEKDRVQVVYHDDSVEVDGTQASFREGGAREFVFPPRLMLEPLPEPYRVPQDKLQDGEFIRALTIKEHSGRLSDSSVLQLGGRAFNSLQLRAIVKDVSLNDPYRNVQRWTDATDEELQNLVFIDTPGLAVSSSDKDEVLRHALAIKNNRIALQLLKEDELDILVHLVLCGRQAVFEDFWRSLEREAGSVEMKDVAERLVLAVNGMNIYFTNEDIQRNIQEGDHFHVTLEDNILQKMSPRGRMQPAALCFLDSKRIVEGGASDPDGYARRYEAFKEQMTSWLEEGTQPREYLATNGWLDSFRENIDALCDPDDRGQGFLVRQILHLIRSKGPLLLLKKHLLRTGLLSLCERTLDLLSKYYDEQGALTSHATQEAVQSIFRCLDQNELSTIDDLCAEAVDQRVDDIVANVETNGDNQWARTVFHESGRHLLNVLLDRSQTDQELSRAFTSYYTTQLENWSEMWGYDACKLPPPGETAGARTVELVAHSTKTHMREILYELLTKQVASGDLSAFRQTEEDQRQMSETITALNAAVSDARRVCTELGVSI